MQHKDQTDKIHEQFVELTNNIFKTKPDFQKSFNTKNLPWHYDYDKEKAPNVIPEMRYFFKELDKIKHHALYYFELKDVKKANELNALIDAYRKPVKERKDGYRVVPASNTYNNSNSKVLYLGVRRGNPTQADGKLTNLVGRINQHLGYYENVSTQGLQLYHYAKGKDFKITLNVYEFKDLDKNYLNVIEKIMAEKLKPHCGRH